jgi:hypothetical protein
MAAGLHHWLMTASKATLAADASEPIAPKRGEFKAGITNCEGAAEAGHSFHRSRAHESKRRAVPVPQ